MSCKNNVRKNNTRANNAGAILLDAVLALTIASVLVAVMVQISMLADSTFAHARARASVLAAYQAGNIVFEPSHPYGNDMYEKNFSVTSSAEYSSSTMSGSRIGFASLSLTDAIGTPLCSVDMIRDKFNYPLPTSSSPQMTVRIIRLPLSTSAGQALTDIQIRNSIAYISTDSPAASDPDIFIVDFSSSTMPIIRGSIDTGPGINALALAGHRIYAAAASVAAQLHVLKINSPDLISLESKIKLPLPYATATPPIGTAVLFNKGRVYLGTDKWDGPELSAFEVDAMNPANMSNRGGVEIGGKVSAILAHDESIYVAAAGELQASKIDARDASHMAVTGIVTPSGWQRQQGLVLSGFEDALSFGRTSGGFDIPADHELFAWPIFDFVSGNMSLNVPGGVYGIVMDRHRIYVATRNATGELLIFDRSSPSKFLMAYPLPVMPQKMTCEGRHLYVLAHGSPEIYDISFSSE